MLPEITDDVIAKTVQTRRMMDAGWGYWQDNRVRQLVHVPKSGAIRALVQGGDISPYDVRLRFVGSGNALRVFGSCTCPVGEGCKHVAATLFAWRAEIGRQDSLRAGGRPVSPHQSEPLPAALSHWLTAMRPLRSQADAVAASHNAVLYVIRAQALSGSARAGAKRPAASLAPAGSPVRLHVEAYHVALDRSGRPRSAGTRVHPPLASYSPIVEPAYLTGEDRVLVRRLQLRVGETDHDGCLAGTGGFDLLARILATDRTRWGGVDGPALREEKTRSVELGWRHDDGGRTCLYLPEVTEGTVLGLVAPPVLIDVASGGVTPLDMGVAAPVAEQLLRLPPVPPEAVATLAAAWCAAVPATVPPPTPPAIRDIGRRAPRPTLTLLIDRVEVEEPVGRGWGRRRKVGADWALARLGFDYGVATVDAASGSDPILLVRHGGGLVRLTRDLPAERAAEERLVQSRLIPLDDFDEVHPSPSQAGDYAPTAFAEPRDFAAFLLLDVEPLRRDGWQVELSDSLPLTLLDADADSAEAVLTPSGVDWFDLELGVRVGEERIDLVPALRRLLSSPGGTIADLLARPPEPGATLPVALGDGRVIAMDADQLLPMLRALLLVATHEGDPDRDARPGLARQNLGLLVELEAATTSLRWRGAEVWRGLARALSRLAFTPTLLPDGFRAELRPYQQTGLDWLQALASAGLGGLLADDMGLGKTVQVLAHIAVQKAQGSDKEPVLVVAPTSVLANWQAEAERFAPNLKVLLLHGPDRHARRSEMSCHDVVLTSYPLLTRDQRALVDARFSLAVFDEAHTLKNPRTATYAAARSLRAERKLALTGTPVENRLLDAWALFDLVAPGLLGNQRSFARTFGDTTAADGDMDGRARLARRIKPFLLRRTKEAVAADLPPKSIVSLSIALEPAQMALHESQRVLMQKRVRAEIARVGLMRAQIIVLSAITRLRQICCDPRLLKDEGGQDVGSAKLERFLALLDEMIPEGRRIILFSQFTSMLDLIKPELDRRGIGWTELTGRTKSRKTPVARFQAGEVPLILVSLKAGGVGLNLTAADTVLLYDPWWNPAVEAQAIDRAHRIGQTKPVFIYRMIAAGTVEEKILSLQRRKAALAEALWSEDASSPAQLSEEDVAFLLG